VAARSLSSFDRAVSDLRAFARVPNTRSAANEHMDSFANAFCQMACEALCEFAVDGRRLPELRTDVCMRVGLIHPSHAEEVDLGQQHPTTTRTTSGNFRGSAIVRGKTVASDLNHS
jgi:hypothetical protein